MTHEGGAGSMGEQGGTDERGVTNEGVTNEARKRRGKVLDGKQQIFKWRLRLAPRWAPSLVFPQLNSARLRLKESRLRLDSDL